jgi:hypothetical protein
MIYIISYPRSGNTALRYIVEVLTGSPTNGLCGPRDPRDKLQLPLVHKGRTDFVAHKRHDFKGVKPEDTVIFVVRDWVEAIVRHNEVRGLGLGQLKAWADGYFKLVEKFDKHPGDKMLVRYDQLMKIARTESLRLYPNPTSRGDPDYHKKKLRKEDLHSLRKYVRQNHGYLLDRYSL